MLNCQSPLSLKAAILAALAVVGLSACQTQAVSQPAVLDAGDIESLARLKSAVARAMGKARVEFGPGDLTNSSEIAALPPRSGPFESHSLALPTYFDLAIKNGDCVVVERRTGDVFEASKVLCKPAES